MPPQHPYVSSSRLRTCRLSTMYENCYNRTHAVQQMRALFNHLVSARKQHRRYVKAERSRGLHIQNELVFGGRLHWQIGRLLALEDTVNVDGGLAKLVDVVWPVADQSTIVDEKAERIDGRQTMASRKR